MDIQLWHDAAIAIQRTKGDSTLIVLSYFLWTGVTKPAQEILSAYNEILAVANKNGYSSPLDFLKDHYHGQYSTEIVRFDEEMPAELLDKLIVLQEKKEKEASVGSQIEQPQVRDEQAMLSTISRTASTEVEESVLPEEDNYVFVPRPVSRPEKLPIEAVEGTSLHIPPHVRCKLTKYKRITNSYRQMDQRHRDADNRFDYFLSKAMSSTSGRFSYTNSEQLNDHPFIGAKLTEKDMEFRKIMARVCKPGNHPGPNRSLWQEEILFLKNYFESKCGPLPSKEFSTRRLATAAAFLMKQLQIMLFETEDSLLSELIFFFKTRLIMFYNFYKK